MEDVTICIHGNTISKLIDYMDKNGYGTFTGAINSLLDEAK